MTNKEFYVAVIKANLTEEVTEKARHLLEVTEKKNAGSSKKQEENRNTNLSLMKGLIEEARKNGIESFSVSELHEITKAELSPSKISALCKVGVEEGILSELEQYKVNGRKVKGYHIC